MHWHGMCACMHTHVYVKACTSNPWITEGHKTTFCTSWIVESRWKPWNWPSIIIHWLQISLRYVLVSHTRLHVRVYVCTCICMYIYTLSQVMCLFLTMYIHTLIYRWCAYFSRGRKDCNRRQRLHVRGDRPAGAYGEWKVACDTYIHI
jgi:hypothetical protein